MIASHPRARVALACLVAACGVGFAGCGSQEEPSTASAPDSGPAPSVSTAPVVTEAEPTLPPETLPPETLPPETLSPTTTVEAPAPVEIVGVYEDVAAYPACGNETLVHQGVTWFPLTHAGYEPVDARLQPRVDEILAVERENPPEGLFVGLARVAPPGPGDDIGTLIVWADGVARWVSDSGDLDVWMVDDEITYNWVC